MRFRLGVLGAIAFACLALGVALLVWSGGESGEQEAARCGHGASQRASECSPQTRPQAPDAANAAGGRAHVEIPRAVVSPHRRRHILDGDGTGGGHRPGTGGAGKSEFPPGWSDDRIIEAIEGVANSPGSVRRLSGNNRTVVEGVRDGVSIRVVIESDGRSIVTGYPTNAPRNARPPG